MDGGAGSSLAVIGLVQRGSVRAGFFCNGSPLRAGLANFRVS